MLNIGRPSSRPIRYVTLYRPAHRADRVTSNGSSICPVRDSIIWPAKDSDI
nr:MAG TPA_asm: hypothetical protein [Caudoviricetes sp.]